MRRLMMTVGLVASTASFSAAALDLTVGVVHTEGFTEGEVYDSGLTLRMAHSIELERTRLRGEARIRWNSARCAAASSADTCDVDPLQFDWRELYLARNIGDWEVSAGLQQVVWGRADNLRVVDIVNPLDLRDFLLPDFNESRMSSGMLRAAGAVGDWNVEAIWLPTFKPTRLAEEGTPYDLGIDADFRAAGLRTLPSDRPERDGSQGEYALRVSTSRGRIDSDLIAFNGYNDDAAYVLDASDPSVPAVRPVYRRHTLLGASFAYVFDSGWVVRSEGSWSRNAPYSNLASTEPLRADTYNLLIGLDYQWRDWLITAQANDRAISGWRPEMAVPERSAIVTLSANGTTHRGRMTHRIAWTTMPQYGDGNWLQWRTAWQLDDHWQIEANLDLLDGRESGFLGQFRDRDRLRLELRYQY